MQSFLAGEVLIILIGLAMFLGLPRPFYGAGLGIIAGAVIGSIVVIVFGAV